MEGGVPLANQQHQQVTIYALSLNNSNDYVDDYNVPAACLGFH